MSSTTLDQLPVAARREGAHRWIESPIFDFVFFIGAPLVMLPFIFAIVQHVRYSIGIAYLLAFPHYFSSAAFYFWDERRDYYRQRWLAFYAGPIILAVVYLILIQYRVPLIIQLVLFFWNTFHVARQSCGILSIYRHRDGVNDSSQRDAANFAIIATSTWFAIWNIATHPQVQPALATIHPYATRALWVAAGVVAILSLGRMGRSLFLRARSGSPIRFPEAAFLTTSLLLFYPYLVFQDSTFATSMMLLPHYVQYLGIVWMLHRRKYRSAEGSLPQRTLAHMSSQLKLLLPILFTIGFAFFAGWAVSRRLGVEPAYETLYLLIAFEHFYLDGLFWAFNRPEIRTSLTPYLMRRPAAA